MIWRGWGWMAFFLPIIPFIACLAVGEPLHVQMGLIGAVSLVISAVLLGLISRYRERRMPDIDHLYFVPMKYWPYVYVVGAVASLIGAYAA
jgi:hypothetical protein